MMDRFFKELRRRNVFRVAGVYAVVGWLLIQVAVAVLPTFEAPAWVAKAFIALILGGFPIALILAWAFEMTPEGMKPTASVPEGESITAKTGRTLDYMIIGGLALVAIMIAADRLIPHATDTQRIAESADKSASVAVLPFIDLSPNGDQEFFSDGISEEILNVLVKIPELKVAGRTSSFSFKGRNEDLREIGAELGVNHVLEGSVRRSGAQLRITAQLIRSSDGFHLWSETYDRELTDIFDIQDDIAKSVAKELAVSLGLKGSATLVADRTEDTHAYENYLKSRQLYLKRGLKNLDAALLLLNEATARDPNFAPAWAQIANVYLVYEAYQPEVPPAGDWRQWRAIGKAAAQRAIDLDPSNAVAWSAFGGYMIYEEDFIEGMKAKAHAVELEPDNPDVLDSSSQMLTALGYWEEAEALSKRAIAIDPLMPIYQNSLGNAYSTGAVFSGDASYLDKAAVTYEKAWDLNPDLRFPVSNLYTLYFGYHEWDAAEAVLRKLKRVKNIPDEEMKAALDLIDAMRGGEATARAYMAAHPDPNEGSHALIGEALRDADIVIKNIQFRWDNDYKQDPQFMYFIAPGVYRDPRWKAAIVKSGVIDLWRSRGFPTGCHALGEDDFECVVEEPK